MNKLRILLVAAVTLASLPVALASPVNEVKEQKPAKLSELAPVSLEPFAAPAAAEFKAVPIVRIGFAELTPIDVQELSMPSEDQPVLLICPERARVMAQVAARLYTGYDVKARRERARGLCAMRSTAGGGDFGGISIGRS